MILENNLKLFNKVLLIVLLVFPCLQILNIYFGVIDQLSSQGFIVILALFAVWAALLKNKELTNLEIVILILFLFEGILGAILSVLFTPGVIVESLFGVSLGVYFVILFIIALLFWFYRLSKPPEGTSKRKITITKLDLLIVVFALILFLVLLGYYVFSN